MNSHLLRAAVVVAALLAFPAQGAAQDIPATCTGWERIAVHTEQIAAGHFRLREKVEITCDTFKFFADEVDLYNEEDRLVATGNVLFTTPDTRISARRLEFDLETKTGTFYDAYGTSAVKPETGTRSMFGTQEADMHFRGEKLEKLGEKKYRLTNGGFTTCLQPTARWEFTSGSVTINIDRYVLATNTVFRVKGVPLLYLPVIYYPLQEDNRATGFLMPGYGVGSFRGQTIRNAFFWAINRSTDLTVEHNYFSKAGQSVNGAFRYILSPGSRGDVNASLLMEKTSETTLPNGAVIPRTEGKTVMVRGSLSQELPGGFRAGAYADYTSSISARSLYDQNIINATNPSSRIDANLSGAIAGWQIGAQYARNEIFYRDGTSSLNGSSPRVNISHAEQPIGNTPVYWGVVAEGAGILEESRGLTATVERNRMRADVMPTVRAPLSKLPWLQLTTSVAWRATWWSESRDPQTAVIIEEPISRNYFEMQANMVGPVFGRVFDTPGLGYAQRWKHVIEPSVTFARTTGIDEVLQKSIIPGDSTDSIVGGVTRVSYGLTNRLYAKKGEGPAGIAREVAALVITQSYYTDPNAVQRDANYRNSITQEALSSQLSPVGMRLRMSPTLTSTVEVAADFDTQFTAIRQISATTTLRLREYLDVSSGWSRKLIIPGLPGFDKPNSGNHYLNASTTMRTTGNKYGGTYQFNYDIMRTGFLNQRVIAYYNAQCCGVGVEYQTVNLPAFAGAQGRVLDRRFNLSFTLAGIGSFSDFFGAFGGDPYRR
ncbi:MAG: hypothetical protein M3Q55_14650 [Acidobacteriota bacterium]|nr:hypothetical protein [Acidobacteriota bacterium]